jgi:hypothetical protein
MSAAGWLDQVALDTMRALIGKTDPSCVEEVIRMALSVAYNQGTIDANFKQIERNNASLRRISTPI